MADKVIQNATGGQYASTHVAGASGAAIAYTGGGRLCKVHVRSSGSAVTDIYDALSATGTPIFTVPANPTIGNTYDVQIPVATGIYVAGASNTSALTVTFNKDGSNGV